MHSQYLILNHQSILNHQFQRNLNRSLAIKTKTKFPLSRKFAFALLGFSLLLAIGPTAQALPPAEDDVQVTSKVSPPKKMAGATITSPKPNTRTNNAIIEVIGTCEPNATVVIRTNGIVVGSTSCTEDGTFRISIQLSPGRNELTALNYDSLDRAGPATPSVLVIFETKPGSPPQPPTPPLPPKPTTCNTYQPPAVTQGGRSRVLVVCMPPFMEPGKTYKLGILIWGGLGPYAVSVDWGNPDIGRSLYSFKTAGYHTLEFTYQRPGTYIASIHLSDQTKYEAFTQVAIVISGETGVFDDSKAGSMLNTSWFYSNVPLYLLLIVFVVSFWLGSLYDRHLRR